MAVGRAVMVASDRTWWLRQSNGGTDRLIGLRLNLVPHRQLPCAGHQLLLPALASAAGCWTLSRHATPRQSYHRSISEYRARACWCCHCGRCGAVRCRAAVGLSVVEGESVHAGMLPHCHVRWVAPLCVVATATTAQLSAPQVHGGCHDGWAVGVAAGPVQW